MPFRVVRSSDEEVGKKGRKHRPYLVELMLRESVNN